MSHMTIDKFNIMMWWPGTRLARDVILTEENSPEYIWFRYSHNDSGIHYEGTG